MVLPQLFSDKGRHALLMYAFILCFSGPSKTTLHNTGILSESLTCLQVRIASLPSDNYYSIRTHYSGKPFINSERAR